MGKQPKLPECSPKHAPTRRPQATATALPTHLRVGLGKADSQGRSQVPQGTESSLLTAGRDRHPRRTA